MDVSKSPPRATRAPVGPAARLAGTHPEAALEGLLALGAIHRRAYQEAYRARGNNHATSACIRSGTRSLVFATMACRPRGTSPPLPGWPQQDHCPPTVSIPRHRQGPPP